MTIIFATVKNQRTTSLTALRISFDRNESFQITIHEETMKKSRLLIGDKVRIGYNPDNNSIYIQRSNVGHSLSAANAPKGQSEKLKGTCNRACIKIKKQENFNPSKSCQGKYRIDELILGGDVYEIIIPPKSHA